MYLPYHVPGYGLPHASAPRDRKDQFAPCADIDDGRRADAEQPCKLGTFLIQNVCTAGHLVQRMRSNEGYPLLQPRFGGGRNNTPVRERARGEKGKVERTIEGLRWGEVATTQNYYIDPL